MTTINGAGGGVLTAAALNSLTALSQTQNLINNVQERLATGKDVSSAIDGASSYFESRAFGARASRLNAVLDNIVSKVSTIEQSQNSVSTLQTFVEDAQDIAGNAAEVFSGTPQEAKITGTRSLTNFTDLPNDLAGVDNGDRLIFTFVDSNGNLNTGNTVTISNGESTNDIIDEINAFVNSAAEQVFDASLNSSGQLEIKTQDNSRFEIEFQASGGGADTQLAAALGFSGFDLNTTTVSVAETRITVAPTPSLTTVSLFAVGGADATASTNLTNLTDTALGALYDLFDGDAGDTIDISVDGESAVSVITDIQSATVQTLIDGINNNGSLNSKIKASFNSGSSTINIRIVDPDVESIQIQIDEDPIPFSPGGRVAKVDLGQLGLGVQNLNSGLDGDNTTSSETLLFNASASTLANLEIDFGDILTQINDLVEDSEVDNVNLLNGDDLTTILNATATSSLTIEGDVLTTSGLSISDANFGTSNNVSSSVSELSNAVDQVERFSTKLASNLSVIEAREDLIQETVNVLGNAAADLTAANEDEDGALLLALQTRQALGVTGLALGAQVQQSVLRLF